MSHRSRRLADLLLLGTLLFIAAPAVGQQGRTLADWQRDLRDPAVQVRVRAARALGALDRRAVAALAGALGDPEYAVRASAVEALGKMTPAHVVPVMVEALGSGDARVRANAAGVLGALGPAAKPAVPSLGRALRDQNLRVRELAGEALDRIVAPGSSQSAAMLYNCH